MKRQGSFENLLLEAQIPDTTCLEHLLRVAVYMRGHYFQVNRIGFTAYWDGDQYYVKYWRYDNKTAFDHKTFTLGEEYEGL